MNSNIIVAVGVAIINKDKKVLIAKRNPDKPMPCKWEFPGGKLEEGESLQDCGKREIFEELALDIKIEDYLGYEDLEYEGKFFCLHLYTASLEDETQIPSLNEHSELAWLAFNELQYYDFPAYKLSFLQPLKESLLD